MDKAKRELKKAEIECHENFDVSEISTIKISSIISFAVFPKNIRQLIFVLKLLSKRKLKFKVIGNASNVLFIEKVTFVVVFTCKMKDEYKIDGESAIFSAGMQLSRVIEILKRNRLGGFEGLIGIPATVGGAIFNNAGAFGYQVSSKLVSLSVFYRGKVITIKREQIKFGYHFSNLKGFVLLSASFLFEKKNEYDIISLCNEYNYKRTATQPSGFSLGSVYQKINGKSAGFYIERAGLKAVRFGGITVSNKHANFFVNDKTGCVYDFLKLQSIVEKRVQEQFGLTLICEIEKVGEDYETSSRPAYTFKL